MHNGVYVEIHLRQSVTRVNAWLNFRDLRQLARNDYPASVIMEIKRRVVGSNEKSEDCRAKKRFLKLPYVSRTCEDYLFGWKTWWKLTTNRLSLTCHFRHQWQLASCSRSKTKSRMWKKDQLLCTACNTTRVETNTYNTNTDWENTVSQTQGTSRECVISVSSSCQSQQKTSNWIRQGQSSRYGNHGHQIESEGVVTHPQSQSRTEQAAWLTVQLRD